jgi:hypothetical protein
MPWKFLGFVLLELGELGAEELATGRLAAAWNL